MTDELPGAANRAAKHHSAVWDAYSELGRTVAESGPLDEQSRRLVKLALAIATGSEGATHSHARRAVAEGIDADALRHVALLAIPTAGFPAAVAGLTWVEDVVGQRE
jgi:alkylhydroperoxidase/carboxymuconolactone decarboxylase family protein YurZ